MSNAEDEGNEYLGTGLAFPFRLDSGSFCLNSGEEHVKQSILLILQTAKGERVMRPDFGSSLNKFVFEGVTTTTIALVKHEVQDALTRFEPRITLLDVDVKYSSSAANLLSINITYRIESTNTVSNLVYPFYLDGGGE